MCKGYPHVRFYKKTVKGPDRSDDGLHRALRKAYLGVGNNEESPVLLKRGLSSKGIATECLAEETILVECSGCSNILGSMEEL